MGHLDFPTLRRLAVGELQDPLRTEALQHVAGCSRCSDLFGAFKDGASPPPPPFEALSAAITPLSQLLGMAPELAALLDVTAPEAEEVLRRAVAPGAWWIPLPYRGIACRPVRTHGPATKRARRFLVRLQPGAQFPKHPHSRDERLLVLQGGVLDDQRREAWRGDLLYARVGEAHSFKVLGDLTCISAVVQTRAVRPPPSRG